MTITNAKLLEVASGVEHIAWPPLAIKEQASLVTLMHEMDASQWLPTAQLVERQHAQLVMLAEHANLHSPYFKQRLEQAGLMPSDLGSPEGLRKLPLLSRREVQQFKADLPCKEVPASHLPLGMAHSSGSTGEPVSIPKTNITRMFWEANMMREHFWHQRDFSERIINIRATTTTPTVQKGWGPPVDSVYKSGEVLAVPATFSSMQIVEAIQEFKPSNLLIYPNTLDGMLAACEKQNITITCLKHVWSIGETLSPELRERAERLLGASIENDYSSNELGIIALQCPISGLLHIMAENVIVEVLDEQGAPCKADEAGKVAVTDLHNFAIPMIRYDIGDVAEAGPACPCGRGLPTLKRIIGRSRNLAVRPDGSRHWPALTRQVIRSKLPILRFQVIQHSLDDVEAKIALEEPFTPEEEAKLREHLHKALDYECNLRFTYFKDTIPLPPNAKFEDFICKVETSAPHA